MAKQDISQLDDTQLNKLIENRWASSEELWEQVKRIYNNNTRIYENKSEWLDGIPERRRKNIVQANRIFVNMEAVINSLIANPAGINILPARKGEDAQDFAARLETYFRKKYSDLNVKETLRMGLRNLYFGRLLVLKPFWNPALGNGGDFDVRAINPRMVRVAKYARKEQDSEFAIEEIEDNLCAVCQRFPTKKQELMKDFGLLDEADLYIKNPDITYKEAWIGDYVIFKYKNIILDKIKNPYWDWEGILVTADEQEKLDNTNEDAMPTDARRDMMLQIKSDQPNRQAQQQASIPQPMSGGTPPQQNAPVTKTPPPTAPANDPGYIDPTMGATSDQYPQANPDYRPYYFNYFDAPRKPYIIATIFNNDNSPIGRTDMITLSSDLQHGIDKRKMDIDENCEFMNGILKVDSSVMDKANAQKIRFETKGVIYGKGVKDGVTRETGVALPQMVFDDMVDSRSEIDNIMAATSAFRGEREGQETKAGRLALIQQSYLRLNELVQVVDFVSKEMFSWFYQLAKTRYTEYHYAKWMGEDEAQQTIELIQDDFETGSEVTVIAGKTLPKDDEFKFEQAQNDVKEGYISPIDYLRIAQYDDPKEMSKNAFLYKVSPYSQFNITDEERAKIPPPVPQSSLREQVAYNELPDSAKIQFLARMGIQVQPQDLLQQTTEAPITIAFDDLPIDGKVQAAAKAGITLDPQLLIAQETMDIQNQAEDRQAKNSPKPAVPQKK